MRRAVPLALITCFAVLAPARAVEVDWFANLHLSPGDRTYLNLSVAHFGAHRDEVEEASHHLHHPERDLPVLLFLASESGRPLSFILDLRLAGASWWEIRARLGVHPDRILVPLSHDPGPPYGKAYGYYRKHPGHRRSAIVVNDSEFADWVGVRILSKAYGVEPSVVLEARRSGTSFGVFATRREKARRKHHDRKDAHHPDTPSHHGKPKGRGRDKGGR
ncbi:MAG: hypothetical protein ACE5HD_00720 [Acidobacteriota bacterium]